MLIRIRRPVAESMARGPEPTSLMIQVSASSAAQYTTSIAPALVVRTVRFDAPPIASYASTTCAAVASRCVLDYV